MKAFHMTLSAAVLGTLLTGAAFAQTATTPSTSSSGTQATTNTSTNQEKRGEKMREHRDKMAKELGLTDDQKSQMKTIHQDARKQAQAIKNDSSLSADQKKAKMKELHEQTMAKSEAILTPEQKQKMEQLKAEHKGKRGHRHHRQNGQSAQQPGK
jgi:Spy/CpxP family protein refolding chaperone